MIGPYKVCEPGLEFLAGMMYSPSKSAGYGGDRREARLTVLETTDIFGINGYTRHIRLPAPAAPGNSHSGAQTIQHSCMRFSVIPCKCPFPVAFDKHTMHFRIRFGKRIFSILLAMEDINY